MGSGLPEPELALQAKLGSIVVHLQEALGRTGHAFDLTAIQGLINDPEVEEWVAELRSMALVPEKRAATEEGS